MNIPFRIALFAIFIAGTTVFGLAAADFSRTNPSPIAMIGAPFDQPAAFFLYDGPPLLN
jgi:hypothetical protein